MLQLRNLLLTARFVEHDPAVIVSLHGLGAVLGARILSDFGDDPNRFGDGKCRESYAGTSPITRASGKSSAAIRAIRSEPVTHRPM